MQYHKAYLSTKIWVRVTTISFLDSFLKLKFLFCFDFLRVRPPGRREAKIKLTERQYSVVHSDWSRAKLVIFILEMDQSENRT